MAGEIKEISFDTLVSYPIAKCIAPLFYYLGITPNMLTISNVIFRIYIINESLKFNNKLFYYLAITNFIDVMDGTLARKYNQITEFGKSLDHISDKIFWGIISIILIYQCRNNNQSLLILSSVFGVVIFALSMCIFQKKCYLSNYIDNNVFIFLFVIYKFHKKCI